MHGLTLTSTDNLDRLISDMRANHIPGLKVITGWGWPWDAASRQKCGTLSGLLVRTVDGDGTRPPFGTEHYIFPEPHRVYDELLPWVSAKPRLVVEIGNEPNAYTAAPDDAPYVFLYYFRQCLQMIRQQFPGVRVLTPGLIEGTGNKAQPHWWEIWSESGIANEVDGIGYHFYAHENFKPTDTGQVQRAHQQLGQYFHDRSWWATEAGINGPKQPDADKCAKYSELHRNMPGNVAMCVWYHICSAPIDDDQRNYAIDSSAFPALQSGGRIP